MQFFLSDPTNKVKIDRSFRNAFSFHKRFNGYCPTPLISSADIAQQLGVKNLLIKNETARFGLPSFKFLGVSWAAYNALKSTLGEISAHSITPEVLKKWALPISSKIMSCASDGNHGLAVAAMAKMLGLKSEIYLPSSVSKEVVARITNFGGVAIIVDGKYDDAVSRANDECYRRGMLLLSDTGIGDASEVPRWVIEGYTTIFEEIANQIPQTVDNIDLIFIQAGVGGLAAASALWKGISSAPKIVTVEPETAPSIMEAIIHGKPIRVRESDTSKMGYLQCGTVSYDSFPILNARVTACLAISDESAEKAVVQLEDDGVFTGPSGSAGLAGLMQIMFQSKSKDFRRHLGVDSKSTILILATEFRQPPFG